MADANDLVKILKRAALDAMESAKPVNVLFGKVQSVDPLKINVEQKMDLGAAQLVLTRNVSDYSVWVTVDWETQGAPAGHRHDVRLADGAASVSGATDDADAPHSHKVSGKKRVTIHNGLAAGDEVLLVRKQGGQEYVVVDKIGGGK